ncbi:hypothetical protein U1Q18_029142, partial [Sarracenia purpurea var. burkii]
RREERVDPWSWRWIGAPSTWNQRRCRDRRRSQRHTDLAPRRKQVLVARGSGHSIGGSNGDRQLVRAPEVVFVGGDFRGVSGAQEEHGSCRRCSAEKKWCVD